VWAKARGTRGVSIGRRAVEAAGGTHLIPRSMCSWIPKPKQPVALKFLFDRLKLLHLHMPPHPAPPATEAKVGQPAGTGTAQAPTLGTALPQATIWYWAGKAALCTCNASPSKAAAGFRGGRHPN